MAEACPSLGLSLQHYYPDLAEMRSRWDIPDHWTMTGQMPFGTAMGKPADKSFRPDQELVAVFE